MCQYHSRAEDGESLASVFGPMGYGSSIQIDYRTSRPGISFQGHPVLNAVGATSVILSASDDADIKINEHLQPLSKGI